MIVTVAAGLLTFVGLIFIDSADKEIHQREEREKELQREYILGRTGSPNFDFLHSPPSL
jgi:hypothetical protein